jgi:hypothetical protein
MRPHVDDTTVRVLLKALPEFESNYLDLVEIYDEDLSPHTVFTEFAEFVSRLLDADEDEDLLERCFEALESVATTPGVDVTEAVAYGFLDGLRPDLRELAESWMGPVTAVIADRLDQGLLDLEDEPLTTEDIAHMRELEAAGAVAAGTTAKLVSLAGEPAGTAPPR